MALVPSGIVRRHFYLDAHIIFTQASYANTSPNGLVIRHILLKVAYHGCQSLVVDRNMIRIDAEDLRPALPAGVLETAFDIGKRKIDLGIDLLLKHARFGVPSAWVVLAVADQESQETPAPVS